MREGTLPNRDRSRVLPLLALEQAVAATYEQRHGHDERGSKVGADDAAQ